MDNILIVTRHQGAKEFLAEHNFHGETKEHVTAQDVAGKVVVGILPYHLAAKAAMVIAIDLPNLTAEQRGQDLTLADLKTAGAKLTPYVVREVQFKEEFHA